MWPPPASAARTAASQPSIVPRSAWIATGLLPSASTSAGDATRARRAAGRRGTRRRAPSRAKPSAVARPKPRPAPVTKTFFSTCLIGLVWGARRRRVNRWRCLLSVVSGDASDVQDESEAAFAAAEQLPSRAPRRAARVRRPARRRHRARTLPATRAGSQISSRAAARRSARPTSPSLAAGRERHNVLATFAGEPRPARPAPQRPPRHEAPRRSRGLEHAALRAGRPRRHADRLGRVRHEGRRRRHHLRRRRGRRGRRPRGTLRVVFTADEEAGGHFGSKWLAEQGLLQGDACVIAEPSGVRRRLGGAASGLARRRDLPDHGRGTQMHSSLSEMLESVNASVQMAAS